MIVFVLHCKYNSLFRLNANKIDETHVNFLLKYGITLLSIGFIQF